MKTNALVIAAFAACLSSSAFAQTYEYRDRAGERYEQQDRYGRYERDDRYDRRDGYRGEYRTGYRHHRPGAGPDENLYAGTRLPMAFWGRQHRVNNWHRARLPAPAQGHNWVRVGNDYAMVNVSTGIISRIIVY
jgi:Ni/Co efflux regulator RcnB